MIDFNFLPGYYPCFKNGGFQNGKSDSVNGNNVTGTHTSVLTGVRGVFILQVVDQGLIY